MTRAASIVGGFAVAMAAAWPAAAADVASASARTTIVDPTGLQLNWQLGQPSVQGVVQGANFVGNMPALGIGTLMPVSARLIIRREDAIGQPATAPTRFEVARLEVAAGTQALIIRTASVDRLPPATIRTIAGGELLGSKAASIDVARGLLFTADGPGFSPQTLVIVVQYN